MERNCPAGRPKRQTRPFHPVVGLEVASTSDSVRLSETEWPKLSAAGSRSDVTVDEKRKELLKQMDDYYGNKIFPIFSGLDAVASEAF